MTRRWKKRRFGARAWRQTGPARNAERWTCKLWFRVQGFGVWNLGLGLRLGVRNGVQGSKCEEDETKEALRRHRLTDTHAQQSVELAFETCRSVSGASLTTGSLVHPLYPALYKRRD